MSRDWSQLFHSNGGLQDTNVVTNVNRNSVIVILVSVRIWSDFISHWPVVDASNEFGGFYGVSGR